VQVSPQAGIYLLMAPLFARDCERAFERAYRRHAGDVYRFALGLLGNTADAEDVTQTTFLNAYRAFERGERIENPRAWFLKIAHNVCLQRFRTESRRPREVQLDPDAADVLVDDADDVPSLEDIRTALGHLSFNQRTVLVLRELDGLSYAEIAELTGLSHASVETLLFRGRRALREQLEAAEAGLGCGEAERLLSRSLDGRLPRRERGLLRAHLRACPECGVAARRQRAQRSALRGLAALPLPATIAAGAGGWSLGGGLAAKAAAVAACAAVVGSGVALEQGLVPAPWASAERVPRVAAVVPPREPAAQKSVRAAALEAPAAPAAVAAEPVVRVAPERRNRSGRDERDERGEERGRRGEERAEQRREDRKQRGEDPAEDAYRDGKEGERGPRHRGEREDKVREKRSARSRDLRRLYRMRTDPRPRPAPVSPRAPGSPFPRL
jgi:RNA polymerase sigma factor (sigma-70 family)